MNPINVTRSSMPPFEEYCEEIKELWDSHWLTNMGIKHRTLEAQLKAYMDTPNIRLFTNGHLALEAAIAAMELTGEVITTPFTFASTTHAIVRCGLKPVFCDIKGDDYTIDVSRIEQLITNKTSAIIPVHVYGNLCDDEAITFIARKHGLKVIYDAAHAFGVTLYGRSAANMGDAAMFSFHATKVFNTIEGGAITYRDETLGDKLSYIKNFGITGPEDVVYSGGNAKMNEFSAAMGICNLRHVDNEILKRKKVHERYCERLDSIKGIRLPKECAGVKQNYTYFPVLFDGYICSRDEVFDHLMAQDITARKYFYPLTNSFVCYRDTHDDKETPVAKHIARHILTLPMYADLEMTDVDRICDIVLK
jgi:dTDP-4-amino-4,6-dideoxygalactose transaminase